MTHIVIPPTMEQTDTTSEREQLRKRARTAETADKRRAAMRSLAALARNRHRDIYDKLARE